MLVYWSIFLYTTVVSFFCVTVNKKRNYNAIVKDENTAVRSVGLFGAMFSFALLVFFASVKTTIADTTAYIVMFTDEERTLSEIPSLLFSGNKGPLFVAIQILFKNCISDNYTLWLSAIAIFQGFAVAKFLSTYSTYFNFSCYLFIANCSFFWMFNGLRQFIAVCIILLASKYLFNKKTIPFMICVFIACLFHNTALLWIPFYFVVQGKPFNKKVIISIFFAILCVVFVDTFTDILGNALEETSYSGATEQFENDDGVNPVTTLLYSIPVIIAFWRRRLITSQAHPRYIDILINMSCVAVAISLIGNFTSGILIGRLPIYFSLGNVVLLPWLINNCFWDKDKPFIKACCYIGYFFYFIYYMYISFGGMPYYSIFPIFNG